MKKQSGKKRQKKRVKPLTNKQKLMYVFHRNKPLFFLFSFLFSLLVIIGSTYAWHTYSDERLNRTVENTGTFDVRLVGDFSSIFFEPGKTVNKPLKVKNTGESPAFVRISLYEFFLSFEVDLSDGEGNGDIKKFNSSNGENVDGTDVNTWKVGHMYKVTDGVYYKGSTAFLSDSTDISTAYRYQETSDFLPLTYRSLIFNASKVKVTTPESGITDYWYYNDGYFYYSEILASRTQTETLLEKITLSTNYPNKYKGSFYQLTPVLDAHDITESVLSDWGLTGTPIETIYQTKIIK